MGSADLAVHTEEFFKPV